MARGLQFVAASIPTAPTSDLLIRMQRAADAHRWEFKARFRRRAFGWRSQPAVERVKQAVGEIKRVARADPILAADGAVTLFERLSPAFEQVDGSSGAIGAAVNGAIAELVPLVAGAPADAKTRCAWLERCWEAHAADQMPYIEALADHWGDLCASKEVASEGPIGCSASRGWRSAPTATFAGTSMGPRPV